VIKVTLNFSGSMSATAKPDKPVPAIKISVLLMEFIYSKITLLYIFGNLSFLR
jgi:hypothetical protein